MNPGESIKLIAKTIFETITGMSESKKFIITRINSYSHKAIDHLIYIFMYPDSESCNHWKQELATYILDVRRIKWDGNNKYLPYTDYFERWFIGPLTDKKRYYSKRVKYKIDYDILKRVYIPESIEHNKQEHKIIDIDPKKLGKFIEEFYQNVSLWLSDYHSSISRQKIYDLVDDLLQKYKLKGG